MKQKVVYGLIAQFLAVVTTLLLIIRSRRHWGLQANPSCSPVCHTLVPVTWLNRLTHQMQERPCGPSNQRNVSCIPELHFQFSQFRFYTWLSLNFNARLLNVKLSMHYCGNYGKKGYWHNAALCSFCYRDHSVGRSPRTPRCCPGTCLEEDPGFYGK